ncbi:MAG: hypothetical protein HZA64_02670 [Rhodocyclales bacterium]|nr:hypothetical protein [Rhodocyclales bacterium]
MNRALELHDSRVDSISTDRGDLTLKFSAAYVHVSEGVPGVDAGSGWGQEGGLIFTSAGYDTSADIGDGWIVEGNISIGGETMSTLPVPFKATGLISAQFGFANGCTLKVAATSVCLSLFGEPRYVEEFPGVSASHSDTQPYGAGNAAR